VGEITKPMDGSGDDGAGGMRGREGERG